MTSGIAALARETQTEIFDRVRRFSDFQPGNDPYGEHDFGSLATSDGESAFWKIDYYALTRRWNSVARRPRTPPAVFGS